MNEKTYAVTLDRDEYEWLVELIEEKKLYYEKELGHVIGDDREWYLRLLPIAERVEQEFDTMLVLRPEKADSHRLYLEAIHKCRRALREPMGAWKGILEREALDALQLLTPRFKEQTP